MKTFKNLVIGGIENKVVNLILITIIVISAAFMGMTLYQNKMLEDVNAETIGKQQQALTDITNGIMNDIVDQSMDQTTELKAQMADEVFHNLAVRVGMMGEYAGKLFQDPSSVGREEYAAPDKAQDGQIVCQTILPRSKYDGYDVYAFRRFGGYEFLLYRAAGRRFSGSGRPLGLEVLGKRRESDLRLQDPPVV